MKVGLLQFDVAWMNVPQNFNTIKQILKDCNDIPQIIFLPEMFDTGYIMSPKSMSAFNPEASIIKMQELATLFHTTLAGTIPNKIGNDYYNSYLFVDKTGVVQKYNKIHLFSLAGESTEFKEGSGVRDINIENLLIRPLVCYDLRFPYASFNNSNYDLLSYAANWPNSRINQWELLLKARAIENQAYVIGVNRIGEDSNGYKYNGHSMIVDYKGEAILECLEKEGLFSTELDLNEMYQYRKSLPFLNDQKPFSF